MSNDKPEVGQKFVHACDGDVTVTGVFKRGKPPKDGSFGGYVTYALIDGEQRRAKYRDWVKAVRS